MDERVCLKAFIEVLQAESEAEAKRSFYYRQVGWIGTAQFADGRSNALTTVFLDLHNLCVKLFGEEWGREGGEG